MPEKKVAKKTTAKTTAKKVNKGDSMVCGVCGLSVVVEELGDIAVAEESALICCGKPMKEKAGKTKATKK